MPLSSPSLKFLCLTTLSMMTLPCFSQMKQRVAVLPFDDRTTAKKDMNIGVKVADQLIGLLTSTGAYTVLDRQYVDKLMREKSLKYDADYDSAAAVQVGLMGTVDVLVVGQIDSFSANSVETSKTKILYRTTEVDGIVNLKATARMISVEKGAIIAAPSAATEQRDVLSKSNSTAQGTKAGDGNLFGQGQNTKNADEALRNLVDKASEEVSKQLSAALEKAALTLPPPTTKGSTTVVSLPSTPPGPGKPPLKATFAGMSEGLAVIDKGAADGVRVGEKFIVQRQVNTGLKTGSGTEIIRHKKVCTLTVTSVEDTSSVGTCILVQPGHSPDSVPKSGDEVVESTL